MARLTIAQRAIIVVDWLDRNKFMIMMLHIALFEVMLFFSLIRAGHTPIESYVMMMQVIVSAFASVFGGLG